MKSKPPMRDCIIIPVSLLLLMCSQLGAQVSRRDMEDIERHRRETARPPVVQSIGSDSLEWESTVVVSTWDFLEGGNPDDDGDGLRVQPDITTGGGPVLDVFWESPDTLLATMVADYITRHRKGLGVVLGRYAAYEDELRAAFRRRGLPENLAILAAVESAMNPLALSRAGARGMWQFMPATARHYGLRCDGIVDERLDYSSSAWAASRYLEKAYERYDDWRLAISSYNCGSGAVDRAISRARSNDFWKIYPFLPAETRGYFPAFAATLYAYCYRDELGIEEVRFTREKEVLFKVECDMTLKEIAGATGIGVSQLRRLNPQFISGVIPGRSRRYYIRIPQSCAEDFDAYVRRM